MSRPASPPSEKGAITTPLSPLPPSGESTTLSLPPTPLRREEGNPNPEGDVVTPKTASSCLRLEDLEPGGLSPSRASAVSRWVWGKLLEREGGRETGVGGMEDWMGRGERKREGKEGKIQEERGEGGKDTAGERGKEAKKRGEMSFMEYRIGGW